MPNQINPDAGLTDAQYRRALECVEFAKKMLALRDSDPAYAPLRPAETWDRETMIGDWVRYNDHILSRPDRALLGRLRLFTGSFTGSDLLEGFSFAAFSAERERYLTEPNARRIAQSRIGAGDVRRFRRWHERLLPERYRIETPNVLGELGLLHRGVICNHNTLDYFERLAILYECGALAYLEARGAARGRKLSLLEIGGGFGFLAYLLTRALPVGRYVIVDIPESLLFSSIYLAAALPGMRHVLVSDPATMDFSADGIYFVPNLFWTEAAAKLGQVDLALNTLSFHEMPRRAVEGYADGIRAVFAAGDPSAPGVLFEQNFENAPEELGCNAKAILRKRFRSTVPAPIYTRQTRGFAELHALDGELLAAMDRARPAVPASLKLQARLSPGYLVERLRANLPGPVKRLLRALIPA